VSERDWKAYGLIAQGFVGQAMRVTVAANSLKLSPEKPGAAGQYIWIDPPWSMWRGEKELVNGGDAPEPEDPVYDQNFRAFCDRVAAIRGVALDDVRFVGDDTTEFLFESELRLIVWHQEVEPGDPRRYDDWYARKDE
jgi:hypothetical protein